jgi:hypothetical protein
MDRGERIVTSPDIDLGPGEKRSAHEAVDRYVERIANAVEAAFGDRVSGVWLIGSLAYGGFGPSSDVDVQAAVRDPADGEVASLVERIRHPQLPCPAAGLEFVLYDVNDLVSPVPPLQWLLNLNGGPTREEKISTDPTSESWHWFLLDLAIGRQTAKTLSGRDLREVVGPISREDQLAAIVESLRWHSSNEEGNANQAANAARGLRFLRTGQWGSKPDALRWASSLGLPTSDLMAELARELETELQS